MEIKELHNAFLKSDGIATDSRMDIRNKIFFALSGENFDGNKFAADAFDKGAMYAVIDNPEFNINNRCVLVKDTLKTLQSLAAFHRKHFKAQVIGITGSNGKTTTKELISRVLKTEKSIISTQGNLNNHIGVPLTLLNIKENTDIAVVEMGANHIGEISHLCDIADPDYGIITNIGAAHLEGFGSFEGVITAKNELYQFLKKKRAKVIVNTDDELLTKLSSDIDKVSYGRNNADVEGEIISSLPFIKVKIGAKNTVMDIDTKIYGNYNLYNIMAAVAAGVMFDISSSNIINAIEAYVPDNNRSQIITTSNNNKIILDAYNANPFSMKEAINSFFSGGFTNKVVILGDMFELGKYSGQEHQKIIWLINSAADVIKILVGNEFCNTKGHGCVCLNTTDEAYKFLENHPIKDSTILIKGSRGMKMESLLSVL